jgi:hypothetical protein
MKSFETKSFEITSIEMINFNMMSSEKSWSIGKRRRHWFLSPHLTFRGTNSCLLCPKLNTARR